MDVIEKLKTDMVALRLAQNGARLAQLSARVDALPGTTKTQAPEGPHAFSAPKTAGLEIHERVMTLRREQPGQSYASALRLVLSDPQCRTLVEAYAGESGGNRAPVVQFDGSTADTYKPKW